MATSNRRQLLQRIVTLTGPKANQSIYIGLQGELTSLTDDIILYLHDGITPGGFPINITGSAGPFRGAFVRLTSASTLAVGSNIIPWDETDYDTDSIWSAGSPTRLTTPADATHVRLVANSRFDVSSFIRTTEVWKNGSVWVDGPLARESVNRGEMSIASAVVPVVGGTDYFELDLGTSAITDAITSNTWFAMEIVSSIG